MNDMHLTHAIRRAGMVNTGRRILAYNNTGAYQRFSVVIVRGEWTVEAVRRAHPGKLLAAMGYKNWTTEKPQPKSRQKPQR